MLFFSIFIYSVYFFTFLKLMTFSDIIFVYGCSLCVPNVENCLFHGDLQLGNKYSEKTVLNSKTAIISSVFFIHVHQ